MIKGIVSYFLSRYPLEIRHAINLKHMCAKISIYRIPNTLDLYFKFRVTNSVEKIEFYLTNRDISRIYSS